MSEPKTRINKSHYAMKKAMFEKVEEIIKGATKAYTEADLDRLILEMDRAFGMRLAAEKYLKQLIDNGLVEQKVLNGRRFGFWNFEVEQKNVSQSTSDIKA